jgi:hypothetical protein
MSDDKRFGSFEDFWPHYVREHSQKTTRRLHFVGTTLAMASVGAAIVLKKPLLLLLAPVLGYGPAWVGHFFVEGNKPASFEHPLYSLRADLKMWTKIIDGSMDGEVERVLAGEPVVTTAATPATAEAKTETNGTQPDVAHETVN